MTRCQQFLNEILGNLSSEFHVVKESDRICTLIPPFDTFGGEGIHVYVEDLGDHFFLTDEGETLSHLRLFGLGIEGEHKAVFNDILSKYRLFHESGALVKSVPKTRGPYGFFQYLNGILAISSIELKKRSSQSQHFDIKVRAHLSSARVPYDRDWSPMVDDIPIKIDFSSIDHSAVFIACGTSAETKGATTSYAKTKLFSYLEAHLTPGLQGLERYTILDEETSWADEARHYASKYSSNVFDWPTQLDDVVELLNDRAPFKANKYVQR